MCVCVLYVMSTSALSYQPGPFGPELSPFPHDPLRYHPIYVYARRMEEEEERREEAIHSMLLSLRPIEAAWVSQSVVTPTEPPPPPTTCECHYPLLLSLSEPYLSLPLSLSLSLSLLANY